ncbi:MAG: glycosyltransferase family 2 protein [Acetatifactor sp.]|nr:glycosyltransferase family 2 protein [Acetatifactor sp.]
MDKILSIIIAAYNVEKYLDKTLRSCVLESQQIQKDYEVIVVNDGSKDETTAIAHEYMRQYPEVFRVIDKSNGGYGSVINEGIKTARGKYFKLLDGDDWYNMEALAEMVQCLKTCDSDMVLTNCVMVYENSGKKEVFRYNMFKEHKEILAKAEHSIEMHSMEMHKVIQNIGMHGICYKTEILRKVPVSITEHCFYTDTEYVIYGAAYAKTIIYYPIDLYQYRIGREGQSVSVEGIAKHIGDLVRVIQDIDAFYEKLTQEENREWVNYRIALTYQVYYEWLLQLPGSRERLHELKEFDKNVRAKYMDRYQWMENRVVRIMRNTSYKAYWPYRIYRRCKRGLSKK